MYQAHIIATDNGRYELTALITKNGFYSPSLCEKPHEENGHEVDNIISDVPDYILYSILPALKNNIAEDNTPLTDLQSSILDKFGDDYDEELIEMIEQAQEIGFFKEK